ncbi:sodium:proton antiporter [Fusobacterium nucleatum subsp. nucleatum ATCC 25586]|uniref:NA+/H+ antiporter NHAC n=1 Tax=Fusobacterium nucleatum subsp. nucleatum (strain ATCC 25586 / DSM 15643 / BCRC 10681 / CIP 101130 / JCM 8532 / KCTC 2640 / LMG 13131 / VPI 4355) TaxID=190304 RepID=Q8REW0_FUSNN|nr:Na+/H+ antiporter NhaC family protein [Fusobacterium nucleatum]AAL95174.1 NA+/H+ antiporter NHAC [Fusobacterium nucleatum subsp. nucleatum ATCC 25586]AVQ15337.1 sodium:proton antiporter [Fusobacterium nucleatum subsp. nucleatum ATCC 25586]WMS30259.1 Na+/H+ antiporter NhaC family protein [Fusobacterium nucleatum]
MGSIIVILLFSLSLIVCLLLKYSVVYALIIGYLIFISYGFMKGHNLIVLIKKSFEGVLTVKNILLVFIFIGMITALWRASGTIAFIVYMGSKLISPSILILLTFLLCSILSVLIGTSLGTAATIGVICFSIGKAMGINPYYVGGAVLSGIYFGDRCSPMSTSALLIAELTKTNLYTNIKLMIKTSIIPFVMTCLFYLFLGFNSTVSNISVNVTEIFKQNYNLNIIVIIPAILIIILSILKINVKKTMLLSIVVSFIIAMFSQKENIVSLINYCIYGYHHPNEKLNLMMKGGGILSMVNVGLIVGISSSYSGIFKETKMLVSLKKYLKDFSKKTSNYFVIFLSSIVSGAIACNQSLGIILTNELCEEIVDKQKRAIILENTVILLTGLIPWNTAMVVPLKTLDVGVMSGLFAFYLYFLPLWNLFLGVMKEKS